MALPEYKSKMNYVWQNLSLSLKAFATKLSPYVGGGGSYSYIGDSSTTTNIDWSVATVQELNMNSNPALTFSNGTEGQKLTLLLKQQNQGQASITWPNDVIWSNSSVPTLQTLPGAGSVDPNIGSKTIGVSFGNPESTYMISDSNKFIVLVTGGAQTYDGISVDKLFRINSDATIDISFTPPSIASPFAGPLTIIKKLNSGKFLVGGDIQTVNSNSVPHGLIRLNADGTFDPTFNTGQTGFFNMGPGQIWAIHEFSDGSLIVGGNFSSYNGGMGNGYLARIDANGAIISSFTSNSGYPNGPILDIKVQPDGKIILVGPFSSFGMISTPGITRLNPNGTHDTTFLSNIGTGFSGASTALAIQPDGKILVGSSASDFNGFSGNKLYRLNSNGSADTAFISLASMSGITALSFSKQITGILLYDNGKILLSGNRCSTGSRYNLFTFTSAGTLDLNDLPLGAGWDPGGMFTGSGYVNSLLYNQDQSAVLISGYGNISTLNTIAKLYLVAPTNTLYNVVNFDYNGTNYIGSF